MSQQKLIGRPGVMDGQPPEKHPGAAEKQQMKKKNPNNIKIISGWQMSRVSRVPLAGALCTGLHITVRKERAAC